jgi:aspartyl-tRNA synthetase
MYRSRNCGELSLKNKGEEALLSGWVQRIRDKGSLMWIDLRDRYGITQLFFSEEKSAESLLAEARSLAREYVISVAGQVIERESKNPDLATGDIEILVTRIEILNPSKLPPFTIEDQSDGGDELRMRYRYLDIRRNPLKNNLILRHTMAMETRKFLSGEDFLEVETPVLIKSTPEGARDFVVPSRMHGGEFYALPQSPQTFKQLLMIAGLDRYFQIVKCFRDEDLRADRQPEFTQIDCELSFVEQEDVLKIFEKFIRHLFQVILGIELSAFDRISYDDALRLYGTDKPDTRFGMPLVELTGLVKGKGFQVFDDADCIAGLVVPGCADYSRKELDKLTDFVKRPQLGARGLVYVKHDKDGGFKSSIDKFYTPDDLKSICDYASCAKGDLLLILSGEEKLNRSALSVLRLEMGSRLGLRDNKKFKAIWVTDFPLFEWNEDDQRFYAMHHPFTSPLTEDLPLLDKEPARIRANAYDMVINGVEVGGGSIRIHDREVQNKVFRVLGFSEEEMYRQFGFLLHAFEYGAPPHGGIAFGFDRLCALFGGSESIRDYIAFPKNNAGRDLMIDSPSSVSEEQLQELHLKILPEKE